MGEWQYCPGSDVFHDLGQRLLGASKKQREASGRTVESASLLAQARWLVRAEISSVGSASAALLAAHAIKIANAAQHKRKLK